MVPDSDARAAIDGTELRARAEATYGPTWRAKLSKLVGVSRQAVVRWENSGITGSRAAEVDRFLLPAKQAPLTARFAAWRSKRFASVDAASLTLGIDRDTIRAMETGRTKNGLDYAPPRWLELVMIGYDAPASAKRKNQLIPPQKDGKLNQPT